MCTCHRDVNAWKLAGKENVIGMTMLGTVTASINHRVKEEKVN